MNVAVGIWKPAGAEINFDRIATQWHTGDWQGACHSVQFFVASEEPLRGPAPKGVMSYEHIDRAPLIDEVVSHFQDHWVRNWADKYRPFFEAAGLRVEAVDWDEQLPATEKWLSEWLKFWSAHQVIQRYWTTYLGTEEMDVVILQNHDFFFEPDSRKTAEFYAGIDALPPHNAERRAAYRYPPLNGAADIFRASNNGETALLAGQSHSVSQLLNPKNIRLYFCEHFQPLQTAMPLDLNPVDCIARLMQLRFQEFAR